MGKFFSTSKKDEHSASDTAQDAEPSASVREESTSYLQGNVTQTEYAGIRSHRFTVNDGVVTLPTGPRVPPVPPAALVCIPSQTNTLSPVIRLALAMNLHYSPFNVKLAGKSTDRKDGECVQKKSDDSAYFSKPTSQADSNVLAVESGNDEYEKSQEDLQVQKESICPAEEPPVVGISTPTTSTTKPLITKEGIRVSPVHVPVSWHDTGQPNTVPSSATPGPDTSTAPVTPGKLLKPSMLKDRQTSGNPIFPPLASTSKKLAQNTLDHDMSAATRKRKGCDLASPGEPLISRLLDPGYEEARQETPWECTDLAPECGSQGETREEDRIYHGYKVKFFTKCIENDPFRNTNRLSSPMESPSETHFTPQPFTYVQTVLPSQISHFVSISPLKDQPFRFHSEGLSIDLDSGYVSNRLQEIN